MGDSPSIITRLGYSSDPAGLQSALADVANYKAQAVLLEQQLNQAKLDLQTQFSAANRAASQERLSDLRSAISQELDSMAQASSAQKQAIMDHVNDLRAQFNAEMQYLSSYDATIQKVNELKQAYLDTSSAQKQASAAVGLFNQQAGGSPLITQLRELAGAMSNLAPTLAPLAGILSKVSSIGSLPIMGEVKAGGSRFEAAGAGAAGGVAAGAAEGEAAESGEAMGAGEGVAAAGLTKIAGGAAIGIAAIVGIAAAMTKAALSAGEWAEQLQLTSEKTGVSVTDLQQLQFVGQTVGLSLDDMTKIFRTLSTSIVNGNPAFDSLGVSTRQANGQLRDTYQVLLDLADAFQKMPEGAEKVNVTTELMSRFGQQIIPVLNMGSAGIRQLSIDAQGFAPDIAKLAGEYEGWEQATTRMSSATNLLKSDLSGMIDIAAGAVTAIAEYIKAAHNAGTTPLLVGGAMNPLGGPEMALGAAITDASSKYSQQPLGPSPVTHPTGMSAPVPPSSLQVEGGIPPVESKQVEQDLVDLAKAEAAAHEKTLDNIQEEYDLEQKLAALQKSFPTLVADPAAQHANLQQQIQLTNELGSVTKENAAKSVEAIKKVDDAYRSVSDQVNKNSEAIGTAVTQDILHPKVEGEGKPTLEDAAIDDTQIKLNSAKQDLAALQTLEQGMMSDEVKNSDALAHNAELQKQAFTEIGKLQMDLYTQEKAAALADEAMLQKTIQETGQALAESDNQSRDVGQPQSGERGSIGDTVASISTAAPPQPVPGAMPITDYSAEITQIKALEDSGMTSATEEISSLKAVQDSLRAELQVRQQILDASIAQNVAGSALTAAQQQQLSQLNAMASLYKSISGDITAASKNSPIAQMTDAMNGLGSMISKFAPAVGKIFSSADTELKVFQASTAQITKLGSTSTDASGTSTDPNSTLMQSISNILTGKSGGAAMVTGTLDLAKVGVGLVGAAQSLLQGPGGAEGAASGAVSMGSMGSGIGEALSKSLSSAPLIGGILGAVAGAITGLFGDANVVAAAQKASQNIAVAMSGIVNSLNTGATNLQQAIAATQAQQVAANAISGKGTNAIAVQTQTAVNNQLAQLQAQQTQILNNFANTLDVLQASVGNQSAITSIQQIAAQLTQAANAGASAAQQLQFFDEAVGQLATTLGTQLQSAEQTTLGQIRQAIDLQQQQQDIITAAANQEMSIRQSLGVSRSLTPAQQAAQQIAAIEQTKQQQLQANQEQMNSLNAQIGGAAALYGYDLQSLNLTTSKTQVIAQQLALQTQITQQAVQQLQAQQQLYSSLVSGIIPTTAPQELTGTFAPPAGSTYTFAPAAGAMPITINYSGSADPNELADALVTALPTAIAQINASRYQGSQ